MLQGSPRTFAQPSLSLTALAQEFWHPLVTGTDLAKILPSTYFFRGLSATTQARNAGALKYSDGFFVIAALVDVGLLLRHQGQIHWLVCTEKQISLGGKTLPPGEYGMIQCRRQIPCYGRCCQ